MEFKVAHKREIMCKYDDLPLSRLLHKAFGDPVTSLVV